MSAPIEQPTARGSGSPAAIWIALSLVYVAWSTTFVGISVVNETMPPLLGGGLRFLIAGGLLLPVALRFGDRRGDRPRAVQWRGAAVVAALMMFGGNGGIVWAERTIPSGMAGLAIATVPLWMAAIDRVVLGHRQPRLVVIGLAVGFVGAALLVGGNALEGEIDMGGLVLALGAAACWAAGSIYQNQLQRSLSLRLGVCWGADCHNTREIDGFSRAQLRAFSKRSAQIEAELEAKGRCMGLLRCACKRTTRRLWPPGSVRITR